MLAKAFIKIAQALEPFFRRMLYAIFGSAKVLIAPIKELRRCKAKLEEIKDNGVPPPYAAGICDFLRATILTKSFVEMLGVLQKLAANFTIVRVKSRITPEVMGNKVFLVNLLVVDKTIRPRKYTWSNWWDNRDVQMIAEVRHK